MFWVEEIFRVFLIFVFSSSNAHGLLQDDDESALPNLPLFY